MISEPAGGETVEPESGQETDPEATRNPEKITETWDGRGARILFANQIGTGALSLATVVAAIARNDSGNFFNLAISAVLFVAGCVGFAIGFGKAVLRSREEEIYLAGLFYMTGTAPESLRRNFLFLWFTQMGIAVVSIFLVQPPFGVMAVVFGSGMICFWAGIYGKFLPKTTL